uniref:MBD domain-containing protein n=2 Tax=Dendroctonus ponderosae TaxID=77166 RepID=A0AAR5P446_DENPD
MGKGKRARIPNKRYSDIVLSPNRRGFKATFDNTTDLDGGSKSDLLENASSGPSLPKRNRNSFPKENIQDPKYFKPFKFGWRRELVWRSTPSDTRKKGSIYYYTPTGKKVRTFRELSDHLTGKNLTLDNFSFSKELLGIDDPLKELSRESNCDKSDSGSGSESPPPSSKKAKKVVSPKSYDSDTSKSDAKSSTSNRRRAASSILNQTSEQSEPEAETSTRKGGKMSLRKGRAPPAKKSRLAKNEEANEIETSASAVRSSPRKTRTSQRSGNLKVTSITNTNANGPDEKHEAKFMENYMQNISFGYNTLLHVFQYLKVQDLLRAGCVCSMWRDIAGSPMLWRTIRMKNSQVHSFVGLANALKKHGTVHLDLRKMLLPSTGDDIWPEFSKAITGVDTLRKIELCRCPASVVEELTKSNPHLEVINAVTIKCESLNLDSFNALKCVKELRLKSTCGLSIKSIDSLRELKTLKILSLTSVTDLHKLDLSVLAELVNLEWLDLGECTDFPKNFGSDILLKLNRLEKLRLEKGQGSCHTFEILEAVKDMERLEQLELVNFDVKTGFDKAIGLCTNIKKLMIIPTYISQSATTNNMVLSGVLQLHESLSHFVWGVTLELLRVTELFVDQCEDSNKNEKKPGGNGDCIPVLKPVPDISNGRSIQAASNPPQVEILPLPNLQKLLLNSLPTTRVKILKIPFHATWRQTLSDTV